MPPTSSTKSARTRQRILDAAARVFSQRGYAGTRLSDIAAEAGTKAGSLYYHFSSKDELVEEVLRASVQATHDYVRAAVEGLGPEASPGQRLRAAIAAHGEAVLRAVDYSAAHVRMIGQVPEELRRRNYRWQRKYGDYWAELFDAARSSGELRGDLDLLLVRMLVLGALNSTTEWPLVLRRSPRQITRTLEVALFEGLQGLVEEDSKLD